MTPLILLEWAGSAFVVVLIFVVSALLLRALGKTFKEPKPSIKIETPMKCEQLDYEKTKKYFDAMKKGIDPYGK